MRSFSDDMVNMSVKDVKRNKIMVSVALGLSIINTIALFIIVI